MSFKGLKTFKSSDKTCAGDILSRFLVFGRRKSSPLSINISWLKQYFVWIYQPQLLFCDFLYICLLYTSQNRMASLMVSSDPLILVRNYFALLLCADANLDKCPVNI